MLWFWRQSKPSGKQYAMPFNGLHVKSMIPFTPSGKRVAASGNFLPRMGIRLISKLSRFPRISRRYALGVDGS